MVAVGLWFRLGVVGAFAVVLAIVMLATGSNVAAALAVLLAGAALAWFAMRRTWSLLEHDDDVPAMSSSTVHAVPPVLRGTRGTLQRG